MLFGIKGSKSRQQELDHYPDSASLEAVIERIQGGETRLREELIETYQPFVKSVVSKVCKRYIDTTMDEFSIGLLAFNQAIDQFKEGKGSKFLTFADLVIRRRVIDFIRKEAKRHQYEQLELSPSEGEEESDESLVHQKAAMDVYQEDLDRDRRVADIQDYASKLAEFDIRFDLLSEQSPKHHDARENAKQVAKTLVENPELTKLFLKTKQLPTKDLLNLVTCSRKTIERNRKYIIAIALIYIGNFTTLMTYIEPNDEGTKK